MKNRFLFMLFIVFISSGIKAQDISGSWGGDVSFQGMSMQLIFNISIENGAYSATMDSPEQGAFGVPMDNCEFRNDTLRMDKREFGLQYIGTFEGGRIQGSLNQAGMELPLDLKKTIDNSSDPLQAEKAASYQRAMEALMQSNIEDRIYTQREVIEDVDFYMKTMQEVCPFPYVKTDSLYVWNIVEDIKAKGDRNAKALLLDFYRLAAAFKTGHVFIFPAETLFEKYSNDGVNIFPFTLQKAENEWAINSVLDANYKHLSGETLQSINGVDVSEFITSMKHHVHSEAEDTEKTVADQIASFLFLNEINAPFSIQLKNKAKGAPKTLKIEGVELSMMHEAPSGSEVAEEEEALSDYVTFENLADDVAYLNLKSMGLFDEKKTQEYFEFIENTFANLKQSQTENLIIDLRENSGGRGQFAEFILPYIANVPYRQSAGETRRVSQQFKDFLQMMPEAMLNAALVQGGLTNYFELPNGTNIKNFDDPWLEEAPNNKFEGKVWCLIGPHTYSAAMMMANAMEDFDLATIVGEPTGGIPNELSDVLPIKMPNSQIAFSAPSVMFTRASGDASNPNPVLPDVEIISSKKDLKEGIDAPLNYILQQIEQ